MKLNDKGLEYTKRNRKLTLITGILAISMMLGTLSACGNGGDNNMKDEHTITGNTTSSSADESAAWMPEHLSELMMSGEYAAIYKQFSSQFKDQVSQGDFEALSAAFTEGVDEFLLSSNFLHNQIDMRVWLSKKGDKGVLAAFGNGGEIIGLQLQELVTYPDTDNTMTETAFDYPVSGQWLVFWGGTNVLQNYHYEIASQRYAYDLIQAREGKSYEDNPSLNESYYAFGQEAIAPAAGTIVSIVNDIVDNEPVGVMNEKEPAGNMVIIDHGGEFSYIAHLKQGSITVNPGDLVEQGQVIGQIGNSGNSSEPHLHFQVSNGSSLFESESLHIQWKDGSRPVQGEIIIAN